MVFSWCSPSILLFSLLCPLFSILEPGFLSQDIEEYNVWGEMPNTVAVCIGFFAGFSNKNVLAFAMQILRGLTYWDAEFILMIDEGYDIYGVVGEQKQ